LIIGVGNPDCGDDAAGIVAVKLLRKRLDHNDSVRLIEHWGEATGLVEAMVGWNRVVIIDAAMSGNASHPWRAFDVTTSPLPSDLTETSSHGFGVAQAIELARALDSLPRLCRVYAIEGRLFETGATLSEDVQEAVNAVVDDITRWLEIGHA
jgi:hydrogenase maturation protease